ncbi:MAG: methyltransferase domain-containing protein [Patulibacter sp.]
MSTDNMRELRRLGYETTRPDVQRLVPHNAQRILDLGCASGALGAALKARQGAEVVGIELLEDYAAEAAEQLDRVICADLNSGLAADDLGTFDCVIAADVLEHLVEPWVTLEAAAARLRPGGTIVISLPNVQYLRTFRELLRGTWPRDDVGPFDRTHLRWFTVRDARALLTDVGATEIAVDWQYFFTGSALRVARGLGERAAPFLAGQMVLAGRFPGSA